MLTGSGLPGVMLFLTGGGSVAHEWGQLILALLDETDEPIKWNAWQTLASKKRCQGVDAGDAFNISTYKLAMESKFGQGKMERAVESWRLNEWIEDLRCIPYAHMLIRHLCTFE